MPKVDKSVLYTFIDRSLIKFYNAYISPETGLTPQEYLLSDIFPLDEILDELSEKRRFYKKARTKTILNWYKTALRDLNSGKPGTICYKHYESLFSGSGASDNSSNSSPSSWNEFCNEYQSKLETWRKNDSLLTEFPFIGSSTFKSKESAFQKEIILNMIELIEKGIGVVPDVDSEYAEGVLLQPLEFLFGPFVSVNSPGVLLLNTELNPNNKDSPFVYNDYRVPKTNNYGELIIRSLLDTSEITDQEINLRSLSAFDVSVLLYIVNYVCEKDYATFLSTRRFQNYLSDIVKAIFPNEARPSARCYSQVRNSLAKLSAISIKSFRNGELVQSIHFFDSYSLIEDEGNGQKVVTLTIGSYMYDRISTKKTQHVYAREVELIKDRSAQFVYYVFESERQWAYAKNIINQELEYTYTYFLHTMRFPCRSTVKKNMDLIESIFKSFVQNDILLLSYKRLPKGFLLKFKPFSKSDIAQLRLSEPSLLYSI